MTTLLLATALATGQLSAQGPRLPRSGQSYLQVAPAPLRLIPLQDSIRVKPNHWKRGATIGFLVSTIPLLLFAVGEGCVGFEGTKAECTAFAIGFIGMVGLIGGISGGLVGSFFPKHEPAKAASGSH